MAENTGKGPTKFGPKGVKKKRKVGGGFPQHPEKNATGERPKIVNLRSETSDNSDVCICEREKEDHYRGT